MKRIFILSLLLLISLCGLLTACGKQTDSAPVRIGTLKGPTGMGMAQWMTDAAAREDSPYTFEVFSAPDQLLSAFISGSLDGAALPANSAALLYRKTEGALRVAAVNTLGVLHILENGDTVHSVSDLKGKTLYATGQGATPEYILRHLLTAGGLDPDKDVNIVYKTEHTELAALLATGDAALGMLPEPNVTVALSQNASLRVALDLNEAWRQYHPDQPLIQGCFVLSADFLRDHPEQVSPLLRAYADSVAFIDRQPDKAARMIAACGILPGEGIAAKAIPGSHIVWLTGSAMKQALTSFYEILMQANPASVGGALPDDGFYYMAP